MVVRDWVRRTNRAIALFGIIYGRVILSQPIFEIAWSAPLADGWQTKPYGINHPD
ncbi:MAG: hypothetical protein RIB93_30435 [Coleofasciculus sp. D1-CHI-01]